MASRRGQVRRVTDAEAEAGAAGAEAPAAPAQSGGVVDHVVKRLNTLTTSASRVASRLGPYASLALDYAWFAGTSALLLSIPILIEIQRETTVMVMQRQREAEIAQLQEQAKMQHGGFVEQMKGLGALVSGGQLGGGQAQ